MLLPGHQDLTTCQLGVGSFMGTGRTPEAAQAGNSGREAQLPCLLPQAIEQNPKA